MTRRQALDFANQLADIQSCCHARLTPTSEPITLTELERLDSELKKLAAVAAHLRDFSMQEHRRLRRR